ncbi:MAG: hypothetical protein WD848_13805 [Dehalococcoidia bacterium]
MYYSGFTIKRIRSVVGKTYGFTLSTATIYEWIQDYSKLAEQELQNIKPLIYNNSWVAYETVIKIGGRDFWLWIIMDSRTGFIFATHLSPEPTAEDANAALRQATQTVRAALPLHMATNHPSIHEAAHGTTPRPIIIELLDSTNITDSPISQLTSAIEMRAKKARGFRTDGTANAFFKGLTVHFNYFSRFQSLAGATPAKAANARSPFSSWEDVAKLDVRPVSHARSRSERLRARLELEMQLQRAIRQLRSGQPLIREPVDVDIEHPDQ